MSDRLQIQITATDGASRVFAQVSSSADRMNSSLKNAGSGITGALNQMDAAIAQAQQSSSRWPNIQQAVGNAFRDVSTFMVENARIAAESEVVHERLRASIEATGESYDTYASAIERAGAAAVQMSFDDEDALNAISAITQATGNAAEAIDQLGLVMDIARGRGIDLASAARIVIAADQERFASLRRIGIALDENATKEEAIAALQQKYSGQAEAYANTTAGALERLGEQWENAREGLAAYSSEATTLAFVLPTLISGVKGLNTALNVLNSVGAPGKAGLLGGLTVGLAGVGYMLAHPEETGISKDVPFFEAFQTNAEQLNLTLSQLADNGQNYAVRIGEESASVISDFAGMAQRQHELLYLIENDTDATASQTRAWTAELASLNQELGPNFADNSAFYLSQLAQDTDALLRFGGEGAGLARDRLAELNRELNSGWLSPSEYISQVHEAATNLDYFNEQAAAGVQSVHDLNEAAAGGQLDIVADNWNTVSVEAARAGSAMTDAELAEFQAQQAALELAKAQENLNKQFTQTQQSLTQYAQAQEDVFRGIVGNTDAIAKQTQEVADWSAGIVVATEHFDEWGNSLGWWSVADALLTTYNATTGEALLTQTDYNAALDANTTIQESNARIQNDVLSIQAQLAPVIATATDALADQFDELAGGSTDAQLFALGMMDAATATQALQLAQAYISDQDTFGPMLQQAAELNPMLAQILEEMGLISYNPATGEVKLLGAEEAQSDLDRLNDTIEKLAYTEILIAVHFNKEEADKQFEELFGYKPGDRGLQQQLLVTLMPEYTVAADADPATVIGEQLTQYPIDPQQVDVPIVPNPVIGGPESGGLGTGPSMGTAIFDPATAQIQEIFGGMPPVDVTVPVNVEYDWQGSGGVTGAPSGDVPQGMATGLGDEALSIVVHVSADTTDADAAISGVSSELSTLSTTDNTATLTVDNSAALESINAATTALTVWGTSASTANVEADNSNAIDTIADATSALYEWDGSSGTADLNVNDNASGVIGNAIFLVNYFDGLSATATITTVYQTVGSPATGTAPAIGLGGVAGYATGGVVAQMGEWGPELLHFPNGGVALARIPGVYTVPAGTYVDTAPATATKLGGTLNVAVNINGPSSWDDAAEQVSRKIIPAIQRAMQQHELSLGVW